MEIFVQFDAANRVQTFRRGPVGSPLMTATYTYYNDDRVQSVTYGNGASTVYTYDAARRLTVIDHKRSSGSTFLKLTYAYTADDLPDTLTEHSGAVQTGLTDFSYDTRDRLIGEVRTNQFGAVVYNRAYQYDQGGNRTKKIDALNQTEVTYHYDYEDPAAYGSDNNRLMYYDTVSTANQMSTPISSTYYYYNESGNVTRVVTKPVASTIYTSTRLEYAKNGQTVAYAIGELWQADGPDPDSCPENFQMNYAREFRYDSGRARYLNRQLDTDALEQNPPVFSVLSETWTDYDGDESYGDFTVSGGTASNARSFELGVATVDPWLSMGGANTKYYHPDLIGTTRWMSTAAGSPTQSAVYTAFGERISGTNHRYGYAGVWAYQSHTEFPFLHVGSRYYDPAIGRFLQRDPIGLQGGSNVYGYLWGTPTKRVDPAGLIPMDDPRYDGLYPDANDLRPPPPSPPTPPKPYNPKGMSPAEELEEIKKGMFINGTCSALGSLIHPIAILPAIIAPLIDQFIHWDEPVNPLFGGDYSNWRPGGAG